MAKEKETKMETATEKKMEAIFSTTLKQSQKVLNLDTMEDSDIELVYNKYVVNEKAPIKEVLAQVEKLVHPELKRAEALAAYATSQAYQEAKKTALSKGNFLTTQLRSTIVGIMQNLPAFADLSAKECFERWLTGFKGKKASAITLLERAKNAIEGSEFSDL